MDEAPPGGQRPRHPGRGLALFGEVRIVQYHHPIPQARFCDQLLHPLALEIFLVALYLGEKLSHIPIAKGEFTRFDFRDLIMLVAIHILQLDLAIMGRIIGRITDGMRLAAMASAFQLTVAPHLWDSALLFAAGLQLAAVSPNCTILAYTLGLNPMLHELVPESPTVRHGSMYMPDRRGLGVTLNHEFVQKYRVP
jgi:L-alanine-DL-glutamate epimerase-like enolase superfamily enzyme